MPRELGGGRRAQLLAGAACLPFCIGGGALMDGGCYALDCLRLLGPGEPSVTAALFSAKR